MPMQKKIWGIAIVCAFLFAYCEPLQDDSTKAHRADSSHVDSINASISMNTTDTESLIEDTPATSTPTPKISAVETKAVSPDSIVAFAQTLIGTKYKYASTNPHEGFDCSGFITYVFNHFNIEVPRSSVDFTHVGKEIPRSEAKPGDLILFTGTDSTIRTVGHMGIIVSDKNEDKLQFIHSTSGKAYSVVITQLDKFYEGRFVKIIRIFDENNRPLALK